MSECHDYKIDTSTPEGAPEAARLPFPADAISGVAGTLIQEARQAFGVDSDIPSGLVLAASAASIGKGLCLEIRGERTPSNLFIIITGKSGCGKSKTFKTVFAPLFALDNEAFAEHRAAATSRESQKRLLEAEAKRIEQSFKGSKKPAEEEARMRHGKKMEALAKIKLEEMPPHIVVENVTTERLGMIIQANNEQIALLSSDCNDVVQNLCGRYSDGKEDENLLLKGFSGDPCRIDRVGRDSVSLQSPCVTLCLVGTPDVLPRLYGNERFLNGGFLPRCLPICSHSSMAYANSNEHAVTARSRQAWDRLLRELHGAFYKSQAPQIVTCAPEAVETFDDFHNGFVKDSNEKRIPPIMDAFASRQAEQAKRIALNLHAMKHGKNAASVPLDKQTACNAVRLAKWFYGQTEAILEASMMQRETADAEKLHDKIVSEGGTMTMRDLNRTRWNEFKVTRYASLYPNLFSIETKTSEKGGRPSRLVKAL
jgi:ABC-type dipeptide/oligopeptide/nickel transport system ATPase component